MGGTEVVAQAPTPPAPTPPAAPGTPAAPAAPAAPGALNIQQETEALMNAAGTLFQEAKYQEALSKIEQIKKNLSGKPFPHVLFIEGASYFNLNDYPKAIIALEEYIKNFETGEMVNQVRLALGRAYINKGEPDKGIEILKEVVNKAPDLKAEAGLFVAEALKKLQKTDEALVVLTSVIEGGIRSPEAIQAAMMAADLYVAKGDVDKATSLMESVRGFASGGDNAAQMNNIYLKLGDQMLEKKSFREALGAYQMVRRKSEITRMQKDRIAQVEQSLKTPGKGPVRGTKEELEGQLKTNKELLEEIEKRTDYDASLYYRLGRCYFEMGLAQPGADKPGDASRLWQAILVFEVIVNDFKEFQQRDRCLFGSIIANAQLRRVKTARELCEKYISDFPDGSDLGTVSEMFGMLAYENGDLPAAVDSLNKAEGFPKADKERLRFLRANILFEMQRFEEARNTFELLMQEFPTSGYKDDALYRVALSYFYQNDSKAVSKALGNYIKENPKGQFIIDAKYRLAFIKFQGREVDSAMKDLEALVAEAPNDQNIGQVYALLGDGFNQKGEYEKAMENFANAVDKAKSPDVLNYAMEQANDLYVSMNKWAELSKMWEKYYNVHKDEEEQALKAILWISRAKVKENKVEEAKKMLAEAIKPKMANPANQQVEGLIQQLVNMMAPKRRRAAAAAPVEGAKTDGEKKAGETAAAAAPAPAAAPTQTFEEVSTQLENLITPPQEAMNGTAQMRILFAKAWLGRVMKEPEKAERLFSIIIEVAKPDDLSPMLLATVGDNARKKGDLEKAQACYDRLNTLFKDTEYADGAAVGLAEIAFEKKEYDKALELFNKAIEEYAASSRLLDATLGKAKSLYQLKKYDDAETLYTQVTNTKEWRGEATATSLLMLGEIEMARKKPEKAIPFYQRVFIAHQKWKPVVAKAYLQCARAFIQLGRPAAPPERANSDREAAKLLLQEMIKRADLKDQPEMKEAQVEAAKL